MNTYIYHSGIVGMKWGKRNGPPYPLKASQKSYAERKHAEKSDDQKRYESLSSKSYKEMSTNELNEFNKRTAAINTYLQNKERQKKGVKKYVSKTSKQIIDKSTTALVAAGSAAIIALFKTPIKNMTSLIATSALDKARALVMASALQFNIMKAVM